jgi:chromosomal replication initiator protein
MKSDHRMKKFVDARQEAMARIYRERPDISMVMIGKLLGGRDHTTVLSALKKLKVWRGAAS